MGRGLRLAAGCDTSVLVQRQRTGAAGSSPVTWDTGAITMLCTWLDGHDRNLISAKGGVLMTTRSVSRP